MASLHEDILRVCALGFDTRSYTALQLFFRVKCHNRAVLSGDDEADVSVIDLDTFNAHKILAEQTQNHPTRPLILLSLEERELRVENAVYVKKPVQINAMLAALDRVAALVAGASTRLASPSVPTPTPIPQETPSNIPEPLPDSASERRAMKIFVAPEEHKAANHAALLLDGYDFKGYIGSLRDIDPRNPEEIRAAQYNPKKYLQGYLQSACKLALTKGYALRLNTGWKPIIIFPKTREVWVDANDHQLRSFCLVPVHSIGELGFADTEGGIMTVSPASTTKQKDDHFDPAKLQRMDALLWKVALWTSAGRVPEDIDLHQPVYLRHWPNFTRLLVFPNALRIAALLSQQPRSLLDVAETLKVRQQYVFAFFSAARALGLADQTSRRSETLIAPAAMQPKQNAGLLKKILQRLLRR